MSQDRQPIWLSEFVMSKKNAYKTIETATHLLKGAYLVGCKSALNCLSDVKRTTAKHTMSYTAIVLGTLWLYA
jgi:hypothetical protein